MRQDLDLLLRPLERAKHARRRAAIRSRHALGALALLALTVALIIFDAHQLAAALALLACGLASIGYQVARSARMPQLVPPEWPLLAVECRLSCAGREALTPMLMAGRITCDEALDWGRAERERLLDDLRGTALSQELHRH